MALCSEISRKVQAGRDTITVTRVLEVEPYSAWYSMAGLLLGGVRLVGGALYRTPPMSDPVIKWAYCDSVDVEGVGTFVGTGPVDPILQLRANNYYRRARMTVVYKNVQQSTEEMDSSAGDAGGDQNETSEIDLATNSMEITAQQLTLPTQYYKWRYSPSNTLQQSGTNATKTMPQITTTNVRNFVVNRPLNAMIALIGRINSSAFRVGGIQWPPETLRYDGSTTTQKTTNTGVKFFEIQHKFAVQPVYDYVARTNEVLGANKSIITKASETALDFVGWNRIFRPDRGFWDTPVLASSVKNGIYRMDNEIIQPGVGSGFRLLFHPRAT